MSLARTTSSSALVEPSAVAARPEPKAAAARGGLSAYLELTKARLSALVLMTTAVGFVVAETTALDWARLAWTLLGTALAAGCANALNQVAEVHRDRRMHRTKNRPLVTGAISRGQAVVVALAMGIAGVALLALLVNALAAGLALLTILLYVLVYTPLKVRSSLNTFVGAVCGAIPPMIGWAGATGGLEAGAWWLGGILFIWQLPHFLALAWLYREDYARGGFVMMPAVDATGRLSGQVVLLTSLALVPLSVLGTFLGLAGWTFAAGATALGLWLLWLGGRLYRQRSDASARRVFLASITYLPLLLVLMVVDRGPANQQSLTLLAGDAAAALTTPPAPTVRAGRRP